MNEYGKIIAVEGNEAVISIQRSSACDRCGACEMGCHEEEMRLTVANSLNGKVGDYVELELSSRQVLKASAITYLIPLAALILGVAVGYWIAGRLSFNPELTGAFTGIGFTILTFYIIRAFEPMFKKGNKYSPQMINIIRNSMEGESQNGK